MMLIIRNKLFFFALLFGLFPIKVVPLQPEIHPYVTREYCDVLKSI